MATLYKTYPDDTTAREAVETLRAAGVPGHAIRLLSGASLHDVRREPAGAFAGTIPPDAPVGTFADVARLRREGHGSFAGDADRQRRGCFADAERDVLVTYDRGAAYARVADRHALEHTLRGWHVVADAAEHVIDELHRGHPTVVVEISEIPASEVRARLDEPGRAA
jgi:hypothetical protein